MEDMLDQANEVQEALGRQYGMPELDDADLDAGKHAITTFYLKIAGGLELSPIFSRPWKLSTNSSDYFPASAPWGKVYQMVSCSA